MKKLAIVITHPIQYYVPVFQLLGKKCELKVFYTWGNEGLKEKFDPGFGKTIAWDLPLLDGYDYELLTNTAKNAGSHHGKGIVNPDIILKLKDFAPNAILIYGYIYHSHFKVMRHFKGKIPIWFRGDSTLLDDKIGIKAIAKKLYLIWVYRYVDKAFYVGSNNKAYFKAYGLKDSQLVFAPHAIDNERFAEDRSIEVKELKCRLGIEKNDVLILFAGKLEPKKNPELLLNAFLQLMEQQENRTNNRDETDFSYAFEMTKNRKVHLLFVGNGILEKGLTSKVESLKLKNVHFLDFQNQTQMPVVYQACDIFCLPSQGRGETWGLAINEAMAAGKAIIASDKVGCALDLVKPGKNGFIYESNSITALADALQKLISTNNYASYGQMSSKIISDWTFNKQVDAILDELAKTN